jgi:hypothetical protein
MIYKSQRVESLLRMIGKPRLPAKEEAAHCSIGAKNRTIFERWGRGLLSK